MIAWFFFLFCGGQYIPSFAQYELDEFIWARLVVITRVFGLTINGVKTDGLVPMADMLNHKRPRQTKWTFDDERQGFTITSISALQRGDQVFDSYGQKCNSRFFVNYGFALEENEVPEFVSPVLRVVCVQLDHAFLACGFCVCPLAGGQ